VGDIVYNTGASQYTVKSKNEAQDGIFLFKSGLYDSRLNTNSPLKNQRAVEDITQKERNED